jgi:hypothetical protein
VVLLETVRSGLRREKTYSVVILELAVVATSIEVRISTADKTMCGGLCSELARSGASR